MKRISTSQFAFINVRVFFGLLVAVTGVLLALLSFGTFSAQAQQNYSVTPRSMDPLVPLFFDCSKIHELGIDRQENLRAGAIMIFCGEAEGGEPGEARSSSAFSKLVQSAMAPVTYGTADVDLITSPPPAARAPSTRRARPRGRPTQWPPDRARAAEP